MIPWIHHDYIIPSSCLLPLTLLLLLVLDRVDHIATVQAVAVLHQVGPLAELRLASAIYIFSKMVHALYFVCSL